MLHSGFHAADVFKACDTEHKSMVEGDQIYHVTDVFTLKSLAKNKQCCLYHVFGCSLASKLVSDVPLGQY